MIMGKNIFGFWGLISFFSIGSWNIISYWTEKNVSCRAYVTRLVHVSVEAKTIIKGMKELLGFQFVSLLCNSWDNDNVRLYKANSNHLIKCNSDLTVEKLQVIQNSKQGHPELILGHPVCQLS